MDLVLIHAGQLAEQKGLQFSVRRFGHELVQEHTALDENVMTRMRQDALRLDEPVAVPKFYLGAIEKEKEMLRRLGQLRESQFDWDFAVEMKRIYRSLIDEFHLAAAELSGSSIDSPVARLIQTIVSKFHRLHESAVQVAKQL